MRFLRHRLRRFRRDERGGILIEFLVLFPLFIFVFTSTFEAGVMNVRHALLERAVDLAVRDLRLGRGSSAPTHDELRATICNYAGMMPKCDERLHIEMERIDSASWTFREGQIACIDTEEEGELTQNFTPGALNDFMLITVCGAFDVMTPASGLGLWLPKIGDSDHYPLIAMSAYVIEP
ncbi:pilus assembly protein [Psychromarinibacter sp. C21-152]|uniref:Pilus assembly protein n=1 Tax=Psychromarinibacter sediminicola TaxID=3033385 RepID=A0AAE3T7B1_9RHOB|nr:TadE family protein [Psychromarinibacter sediminicola]MDF0600140.1 pilus assembly protein [Psychromarinibacter sediminicola]